MERYQIVKVKIADYCGYPEEEVILLKDLDLGIYYSFVTEDELVVEKDVDVIVQFQSEEVVA